MSVAFTKEQDAESAAADLPDRPISPHPNLVTAEGLARLEAALAAARAAYSLAKSSTDVQDDRTPLARATRDLRYCIARRASAQRVEFNPSAGIVRFGAAVTFAREDGRQETFHIVGEDEAEPAAGAVSYISPLARALLGKCVGDTAMVGAGEVEIIAIA